MSLAKGVSASGQSDRFLMVHGHALERHFHVARRLQRVGIAARTFGIDVDEAHLDRCQRVFQVHFLIRLDARFGTLADPFFLRAPINVALGFEHILAAAAKAEHRPAHLLDRNVAGEDEQIGPADVLAVFLLDRPQQTPRLVEVAVVGPTVERSEALLPAVRPAAPVAGAIGARGMPGHADEERAVIAIIRRPPRLAVGQQRLEVAFQRPVIERLERFGIIEVGAHRIGRAAVLRQDLERERIRPPVAIGPAHERSARRGRLHRAAHLTGLRVHGHFLCGIEVDRHARRIR